MSYLPTRGSEWQGIGYGKQRFGLGDACYAVYDAKGTWIGGGKRIDQSALTVPEGGTSATWNQNEPCPSPTLGTRAPVPSPAPSTSMAVSTRTVAIGAVVLIGGYLLLRRKR